MRFVVLHHQCPPGAARPSHWDFMLQQSEGLRTWALVAPPDAAGPIEAERLADHRLAYLDYEGPISGNRGTVVRWDAGSYEGILDEPLRVVVQLSGTRMQGQVELVCDAGDEAQRWRFSFSSD